MGRSATIPLQVGVVTVSTLTVAATEMPWPARRGAQIAIDPARDTGGGRHLERDRFGDASPTIRLGQVGDLDLAVIAGGIAQGEELIEACPARPSAKYHTLLPVLSPGAGLALVRELRYLHS